MREMTRNESPIPPIGAGVSVATGGPARRPPQEEDLRVPRAVTMKRSAFRSLRHRASVFVRTVLMGVVIVGVGLIIWFVLRSHAIVTAINRQQDALQAFYDYSPQDLRGKAGDVLRPQRTDASVPGGVAVDADDRPEARRRLGAWNGRASPPVRALACRRPFVAPDMVDRHDIPRLGRRGNRLCGPGHARASAIPGCQSGGVRCRELRASGNEPA